MAEGGGRLSPNAKTNFAKPFPPLGSIHQFSQKKKKNYSLPPQECETIIQGRKIFIGKIYFHHTIGFVLYSLNYVPHCTHKLPIAPFIYFFHQIGHKLTF